MPRKPHKPRNYMLAAGIPRYSRSAMYRRSGRGAMKKAKKTTMKNLKPVESPKKTKKEKRKPSFYPADYIRKPLERKGKPKPTKLRKSITPGTILILLSGRFRGKRVVFLKQLPSGLLLVTGPYKINGVPLRRVNQAYVIATSTKVDLTGIDSSKFEDAQFRPDAKKAKKAAKTDKSFFETDSKEKVVDEVFVKAKDTQKEFDKQLLAVIDKVPNLREYLNARFSLSTRALYPHLIKF